MNQKLIHTLRWIARIQSIASILFFLFFFIGETFFPPESKAIKTDAGFMDALPLYLFFVCIAGLAFSWKWEFAGGLTATLAFIGMAVINPNVFGSLLLIYLLNGLLFLVLGLLDKRHTKATL